LSTYDDALRDAGGDPFMALREVCICYDWIRSRASAGYVRANTAHLPWNPDPIPDTTSTGDDWLQTGIDREAAV